MLSYVSFHTHARRTGADSFTPLRSQLVPATAGSEDAVMAGELFVVEDSKAALRPGASTPHTSSTFSAYPPFRARSGTIIPVGYTATSPPRVSK